VDFKDSAKEAEFRTEVRAWLDRHAAAKMEANQPLSPFQGLDDRPDVISEAKAWQRKFAEAGWAAITWPPEYGGRGTGPLEAIVFGEELARYDIPVHYFTIGLGMIGPTIIVHGNESQKQRYLPPMLRGDEIWCQLWSEPDAGSDLAGLSARAERHGDVFVISGQKIWTSGAHYSDFGLGVFRTDPDVPKHRGISAIVVPMATPGITVRPLRQINGGAHFNEVFFDDVRVPSDSLLGDLNDGWRVARTMMMNERLLAGISISVGNAMASLLELARCTIRDGAPAAEDPVIRQRIARAYTLVRLLDLTTARVRTALARNSIPGPEVSILKLFAALVGTEFAETGMAVLGAAGGLWGDSAPEHGRWACALVESFMMHIAGGTDEIQRNIIGEIVLGLPRDLNPDRDVPFRDLRTSTAADKP
jgi:alkylation response protein AidB-like acyl-CoA dehydrogenase